MSGNLLTITDLTVGFSRPNVGPLSFTLGRGERVGVWGPGGCGKSALLRAIARGAEVFAGDIVRATDLTFAYLEQHPTRGRGLPMTVREYLGLAGATAWTPPSRIEALLNSRLDDLTGHEFQLLAVWAALAAPADLILMDEPAGSLDAIDRALLVNLIERYAGDRGLLIASHSWMFLSAACTRVIEVGEWT